MRLGVPRRAGRIGKRVRIPRGRATVKIVADERRCKSQETCPNAICSLRTPRARVFRPPWEFSSQKRSRRQPVAFAWQKGRRDFVFSANFGVRRQRQRFGFTERSKAASRYACRGTPNSVDRDADRAGNVVLLRSTKENVYLHN